MGPRQGTQIGTMGASAGSETEAFIDQFAQVHPEKGQRHSDPPGAGNVPSGEGTTLGSYFLVAFS
jgi:hypothetical protein